MGLPAPQPVHARHRHGAGREHDHGKAAALHGARPFRAAPHLIAAALLALAAGLALAQTGPAQTTPPLQTLRIATFATELSRDGPGLLLRDILRGDDQVEAVARVVAAADPDVLLLTGIDYDLHGVALAALAERLAAAGAAYPHRFALRPNSGRASGTDLDGDGRSHRARDSHGFGLFSGQGGLALLSRLPIDETGVRDFSALLWRDLPGARLPVVDGQPFPSAEAQAVQRLSATAHWDVPLETPSGGRLHLLAFAASPPVFDGPEDRNGLRNADEIRFWQLLLDGRVAPPPGGPFVILGTANLDPVDGEGRHQAIRVLLDDPRLQDPRPRSAGGAQVGTPGHRGDPGLDTADWWEEDDGPGNLRVDYVLPASSLTVVASGVAWTAPSDDPGMADIERRASRHRLVWLDLVADGGS